jgi:hypothetical protein
MCREIEWIHSVVFDITCTGEEVNGTFAAIDIQSRRFCHFPIPYVKQQHRA